MVFSCIWSPCKKEKEWEFCTDLVCQEMKTRVFKLIKGLLFLSKWCKKAKESLKFTQKLYLNGVYIQEDGWELQRKKAITMKLRFNCECVCIYIYIGKVDFACRNVDKMRAKLVWVGFAKLAQVVEMLKNRTCIVHRLNFCLQKGEFKWIWSVSQGWKIGKLIRGLEIN